MPDEERIIYESAIAEYRQALADTQWSLAQANGRLKARDEAIARLESSMAPKPGPPPAR